MALICDHPLSGTDIRRLLLTDRCASAWLRERHHRWPVTTNPHPLINRWTAVDTTEPPPT
ncbi:hypothetical protein ACWF94_06090 [Streptomyces sp. NPDC055078]